MITTILSKSGTLAIPIVRWLVYRDRFFGGRVSVHHFMPQVAKTSHPAIQFIWTGIFGLFYRFDRVAKDTLQDNLLCQFIFPKGILRAPLLAECG